ncbi:copper chaperone PCu(A)C [Campylobacter sp. MIT 97-5078]|uniref:copper chaperone PCu(A)C n=1 Tax=Campylobacter sp. MIT 97-5078 TaxID=1548153 RepID=UPI0009DCF928|nr:copper chaperone PCu(A)C [Campylobacter sp. MIT 97-5078]TQR27593.1 copper chaperone PCu(A)C [Campylobacter sp. MIT 97-5078]
MKKIILAFLSCVVLGFAQQHTHSKDQSLASDFTLNNGSISVEGAYILQTPPNRKNTAIFLSIYNNTDKDIALIKATSNLTQKVELHTHVDSHMQAVDKIVIKAHSKAILQSGGDHIMLFDTNVNKNTQTHLELYFDNKEKIILENIPSKSLVTKNE